MFKKSKLLYLLILTIHFSLFTIHCSAQEDVKDSIVFTPMFAVHYSGQLPGNDLAKMFGFSSNIGGSFMIKNKKNWLFGVDYNFIFGNIIKDDSILKGISTKEGSVTAGDGSVANVNEYERGFYADARIGKIFPILGSNPNSGILITGSLGFLEHKIRIEVQDNNAPQLSTAYRTGYDRLTSGLAASEFIGYMYLGNNRLISFYGGVELLQGWTQGRRAWQYDLMGPYHTRSFDTLYSLTFGWIIPLYKRASQSKGGFYYF